MPNCHGSVLVGQRDVNIRLCVRRRWCCALSLTLFKHLAAVPRLMHCHLYFLLGLFIQPSKFSFLLSGSSACACSSDLWLRMVQIINGDIVQGLCQQLYISWSVAWVAPAWWADTSTCSAGLCCR